MKRTAAFALIIILLFSRISGAFAANGEETPSGIPFSGLEKFIDEYMAQFIGKTSPGAAVVIVKDGRIILSKGFGYANIEKEIPAGSADTVFEYGSVSKIFVYTAIMRLWEQGKIDLNADIRQYLPEGFLKKIRYDEPITMLDIMNHTTGFEDYLFDVILTSSKNLPALEQTLKESQPEQVYKPGTVSAYSNYAVALAAYIAEQIIGQSFYEYLMETIFLPLGMEHTSAHPVLADRPALIDIKANGYYPDMKGNFTAGSWSYIPLYPVGAINGTAEDLARFAIAFMPEEGQNCRLFDNSGTLDEMLTQTRPMGPGVTGFAHGFIEWDGEYRGVGHGGNTAAFSSQINIVPQERFGVIVLTNAASEIDITSGLTEVLIGKRDKSVISVSGTLPDAKEVEGVYVSARSMYSSFLELYSYLSLLTVKSLGSDKIQLGLGGQTSTLVQISPYVYQRIGANGPILKYHFGTVYFEMSGGKVGRISGDFLPLPSGRTMPWLITYMLIAAISAVYFAVAPAVLVIRKLRHTRKLRRAGYKNEQAEVLPYSNRMHRGITLLVLCGTATLVNNAALVVRMLINNYRSFSEMRIHILLNYPLAVSAAALIILLIKNRKGAHTSKGQKAFYAASICIMIALMAVLAEWNFFSVIA